MRISCLGLVDSFLHHGHTQIPMMSWILSSLEISLDSLIYCRPMCLPMAQEDVNSASFYGLTQLQTSIVMVFCGTIGKYCKPSQFWVPCIHTWFKPNYNDYYCCRMSWVVHNRNFRHGILWTWDLVTTSQWLWQEYQAQKLAQLASKSFVCKKVLPDTKKLLFLYWQIEILKDVEVRLYRRFLSCLEKLVKIL
jgi:hypothetical protein